MRRIFKHYTIKTQLVSVYMCIYLFVCPELIEETTISTWLIFGIQGYFGPGSDKIES